jgi:hypothetical protein
MLTVLLPPSQAAWTVAVPVVGPMSITQELLAGQTPGRLRPGLALTGTGSPALPFIALTARLIRREAVLFAGQ